MKARSLRRYALALMLLTGVTIASPHAALAQQDGPGAPVDPGLDELLGMQVERVFGASMRLQPLTDAPASVTIITAEEIERRGYRTLADVLRSVRGLYVSYDRNYSYAGARGFSLPGDYNTRVLLLVDGHRMNDNIYDQAAIGPEFGIDPALFERVEIIRGPSASLYGTSAFFAVVNVISKSGRTLDGISGAAETGSFGLQRAQVAAGRLLTNGVDVALSATVEHADGAKGLYFPEFDSPETNGGIAEGLDDEQVEQVFARFSIKGLTATGGYGRRAKGVPTASYYTNFNDDRLRTTDSRGFADLQYQQRLGATLLDLRTYVDHYHYEGVYPELEDAIFDAAAGDWWGGEARVSRPLAGRQSLTAGVEYRNNFRQMQESYYVGGQSLLDADRASAVAGTFVQDEIALSDRVLVSGGLRYDHYREFSRVSPRAAVIFHPTANRSLKYLYGQAFRAPNAYEVDYYGLVQSPLRAETIVSHEVVWEEYTRDWLRTSASAYVNDVDALLTLQGSGDELFFANEGRVKSTGVELELEAKLNGLQALASYTLQDTTDEETRTTLVNSPRHAMKGSLTMPVWRHGGFASFELQHLGARRTLAGETVGAASLGRVTVTQPLARAFSLTAQIRNVFDQEYGDPASAEHLQDTIVQDGRTFIVGLRWHVGR